MRSGKKREKKGDVYDFMLLWQEVETFKKKHKIIDVPFFFLFKSDLVKAKLNEAKSQAKTYSKELINEFGYQVKLQTFAVISIGFDRLLYKKI